MSIEVDMPAVTPHEAGLAQPSAKNELRKVAVGRLLLGALQGNTDELTHMLEVHDAQYRTERAGLLYLPEETVGRYAGKTIMGKQRLVEAIDQLGQASDTELNVIRRNVILFPINRESKKADFYTVSALMDRAFDERGATNLPKYEKRVLEKTFHIPHTKLLNPKIRFGTLTLPYGSPDKNALEEMFNGLYATHLHVGKVQLLDQR